MKKALVFGITGMDGYYLTKLLLEKDYKIIGVVRRHSQPSLGSLIYLQSADLAKITIVYGDVTDTSIIYQLIAEKPDEIYNLAAQSHVKISWDNPNVTYEINTGGILNTLNAMQLAAPKSRLYFAGSSEQFGNSKDERQNEDTPFNPQSPYAISKTAAFNYVKNYRESYGLYACSGICFNHECISLKNVIMIKKDGFINICYVEDLHKQHGDCSIQTYDYTDKDIGILTSEGFKKIKTLTIRSKFTINDPKMRHVETRNGFIQVTNEHNCLLPSNKKIKAKDIKKIDILKTCEFPLNTKTEISEDMARFLGYMVADGSIYESDKNMRMKYTKNDDKLRNEVSVLANKLFMFNATEGLSASGFSNNKVKYISFTNSSQEILRYLRSLIYHKDGKKKVPQIILNSSIEAMKSFFDAYYDGDGLKKHKGNFKYASIKSNSALLMQGLYYISQVALGLECLFYSFQQNGFTYYCINFNKKDSKFGKNFLKNKKEVTKNFEIDEEKWVYDIETENGELQLGIGNIVVANSPLRGLEFVTRKISYHVAMIKKGYTKELRLGNIDSKRDWGYAGDYVEAMWLMLQQNEAKDYVIGTGETHSIKEFLEIAFNHVGLNWQEYVVIDDAFKRPVDVNSLCADTGRIKKELGWEPKVKFEELVRMMIDSDMEKVK